MKPILFAVSFLFTLTAHAASVKCNVKIQNFFTGQVTNTPVEFAIGQQGAQIIEEIAFMAGSQDGTSVTVAVFYKGAGNHSSGAQKASTSIDAETPTGSKTATIDCAIE